MNAKLFVANLSFSTTEAELKSIFEPFGTIVSLKIPVDRERPGQNRGFGFLEFSTPKEAAAAIQSTNGREVQGRALRVQFSEPKDSRPARSEYSTRPQRPVTPYSGTPFEASFQGQQPEMTSHQGFDSRNPKRNNFRDRDRRRGDRQYE